MRDVRPEEVERAKENVDNFSDLKNYFGADWLKSHLQIEERDKKHPIFWILIDSDACSKLSNNLSIFNSHCNKFPRIINKLKNDEDRFNFNSLITELEVLAHYYVKFGANNVDYEPHIKEKNKYIEAKLIIDGKDYYLEILTVFEDEMEKKINKIHDEIRKELDQLEQPFIIAFCTEIDFIEEDIEGFLEFIKTLLKNKESIKHKDSFDYLKNDRKMAEVTFYIGHKNKTKSVGAMSHSRVEMNTARRIKDKVLSKIEQLPENTKNIVVVNLSHISNDFIDIEDAFLGQFYAIVNINEKPLEARSSRYPNGIIYHEKGKYISMVIAYTNPNYENRIFCLNPYAKNVIDESFCGKM